MGKSLKSAVELVERMDATTWSIFDDIIQLAAEYQAQAAEIRNSVCQALQADEYAVPLAAALREAQAGAVRLLSEAAKRRAPPQPVPTPPAPPSTPPTSPGRITVKKGEEADLTADKAKKVLTRIQSELEAEASRRLTISWRIDKDGA